MSARIPPGFAEAWMQFNVTGDPENMYTALGLDLAVGVTATQAAADAILAAMQGAIDNAVGNDYTIGPGHVIFGQDGGDIRIDGSTAPVAGLGVGPSLPNNCAWLLRKLTASGGRRGRGRMYIPGCIESGVGASGGVGGAAFTVLQAVGTNLISALEALAEVEDVVLLHDTAPFDPTDITAIEPSTKIATQRRRLRP